jgi:hypothetical protein
MSSGLPFKKIFLINKRNLLNYRQNIKSQIKWLGLLWCNILVYAKW